MDPTLRKSHDTLINYQETFRFFQLLLIISQDYTESIKFYENRTRALYYQTLNRYLLKLSQERKNFALSKKKIGHHYTILYSLRDRWY